MIDIFREVRELVSAEDAARHYGLEITRSGKACCPFHTEKTPSLSFKDGRFKCFGCGVSGDSIDYTARLLGLNATEAVKELNNAFALGIPLNCKINKKERQAIHHQRQVADAHKFFEEWRNNFINELNAAYRRGHLLQITDIDKLSERDAITLKMQANFEYWSDLLIFGTPSDQAQVYRERREIKKWIDKVLRS